MGWLAAGCRGCSGGCSGGYRWLRGQEELTLEQRMKETREFAAFALGAMEVPRGAGRFEQLCLCVVGVFFE